MAVAKEGEGPGQGPLQQQLVIAHHGQSDAAGAGGSPGALLGHGAGGVALTGHAVDLAVYSRTRHFRMLGSCKGGK